MRNIGFLAVVAAGMAALTPLCVAGRTVSANYTLTQDEDWTSDGTVQIENAATIDLNGHNLTVAGLSAYCITNKTGVVAGYSDLAFLDTSGGGGSGQRILTDFKPQDSDVVYMGVKFHLGGAANQMLWCDRSTKSKNMFTGARVSGNFRFDRATSSALTGSPHAAVDDVYYNIVADYSTCVCTVNDEAAGVMKVNTAFTPPTNLVLFASFEISSGVMSGWNNHADLRFYYLIVMRNGVEAAHFVPALRQSDGTVGVYDRIGGKFYENAGTGAFSAGEGTITNSAPGAPAELRLDIPEGSDDYQELSYIEATGRECIFTDYTPVGTDRVEMKVNITSTNVQQCLFCTRNSQTSRSFTLFTMDQTGYEGKYFRFDYANTQTFGNQVFEGRDIVIWVNGNTRESNLGLGAPFATAATPVPPSPFMLFASYYYSGTVTNTLYNYARAKCYYFRVYDADGYLKCDMVPARSPEGVVGMYDRVAHKFFGSYKTAFSVHGASKDVDFIFDNRIVSFVGNMKVVKKGKGFYVASRSGQTYTGGTEVQDGLAQCGAHGSANPFGADGSAITVASGGVIDMNGKLNYGNYLFTLAGGMITNSVDQGGTYGKTCIADVTLTADSSIVAGGKYAIAQNTNDVWSTRLDLGGNKLTIKTPLAFYFRGVDAVSPGTIEMHGPRLIEFYKTDSNLERVNMIVTDGGQLRVNDCVIKLGGYVSDAEAEEASPSYNTGKIEVYGTFKPNTDYYRGLEIQNGATIDLTGRTTPLPCQSLIGTNCVANAKNLTFADNAMIRVTWNGRTIPTRQPLIMWTAETKPANLDTLTFVRDAGESILPLMKLNDGVYQSKGLSITFR